ncbi:hypothetical protein [Medusavirus stheno T3]|uniref:Uncharacterized protein n=1 Tax=Medusavirus stheno T3 TaxID=3069717 RepID=A0A7S8BD69_9VIRU|nr:hypothetical protein QKU73_gp231 [Acanthamoeba castellanii medusavirus]QPB44544.1 hypothetical protein [Medusavirus stheno T3]
MRFVLVFQVVDHATNQWKTKCVSRPDCVEFFNEYRAAWMRAHPETSVRAFVERVP